MKEINLMKFCDLIQYIQIINTNIAASCTQN